VPPVIVTVQTTISQKHLLRPHRLKLVKKSFVLNTSPGLAATLVGTMKAEYLANKFKSLPSAFPVLWPNSRARVSRI
jgi:hypothetical protein